MADLAELSLHWLGLDPSKDNDYWERADADRDEAVDFYDFALLALNWRTSR
jgi:hypothetical protein